MRSREIHRSNPIESLESRRMLSAVELLLSDSTATATPENGTYLVQVSPNGRYIAFETRSTDVLSGITDTNTTGEKIYLRDRFTNALRLVSFANGSTTTTAGGTLSLLSFSPDSRYLLMSGFNTDLTALSDGGRTQLFLYDTLTKTNRMVTINAAKTAGGNGLDGSATTPEFALTNGQTTGVVYVDQASDLVAGITDDNERPDIFYYDIASSTNSYVSARPDGTLSPQAARSPSVSHDGRYVIFHSDAPDIVTVKGSSEASSDIDDDIFIRDLQNRTTRRVTERLSDGLFGDAGSFTDFGFSPSGRYFAYKTDATDLFDGVSDNNGGDDLIVYDTVTATNRYVTQRPDGTGASDITPADLAEPILAAQWAAGDRLVFTSTHTQLVQGITDSNNAADVFVYNPSSRTTTLISRASSTSATANGASQLASVVPTGNVIVFRSQASNLIAGITRGNSDDDLYTYDLDTDAKIVVSISTTANKTANADSGSSAAITPDGKWVAFISAASNLVSGLSDNNSTDDLFLRNLTTGATQIVSATPANAPLGFTQPDFFVSSDNSLLFFLSGDGSYVSGITDNNGGADAFDVQIGPAPQPTNPTATLSPIPVVTQIATAEAFDVVYRGDTDIDINSIDSQDLTVTNISGFSAAATLVGISGSGPLVTVHYSITGPGGNFDFSDSGVYTISMNNQQVDDDGGRFVAAASLGTFTINIANNPTASLSAKAITKAGARTYTFRVTYTDGVGIKSSTIGTGDIQVTGPKHYSQNATLVSKKPSTGNPKSITVTYSITAPGGVFDKADNGTYSFKLLKDQVKNTANKSIAAKVLGTIKISITA